MKNLTQIIGTTIIVALMIANIIVDQSHGIELSFSCDLNSDIFYLGFVSGRVLSLIKKFYLICI